MSYEEEEEDTCHTSYEEEDTCHTSYEEEDTCHTSYEEEDTCHTAYEEEDTWHTSYEEEDTCVHHLDRTCPLAHSIPLDIERARRRHFQRLRAKLRAEARTRENRYTVAKQRREKLLEAALLI